jgi:hypothetical protein
MRAFSKLRGLARDDDESRPAFWECPSPIVFTYHKAQGKIYYEPNLCTSGRVGGGGIFCVLLNGGRVLTPMSRHNFAPIFEEGN